jgi:VIT1/CCC1 family predicted Fe2+/Mn2+ transporter
MNRFLADFTMGFADGLTVPFALTAGLSSLGQTDTVIYAGMAEICAGSISMGIGGYLSAKGEAASAASTRTSDHYYDLEEVMDKATRSGEEKVGSLDGIVEDDVVERYLEPLDLPPHVWRLVREHISSKPQVSRAIMARNADEERDGRKCSPVIAGLSVMLGYVLGGLLPLFPYFFVNNVGDGLIWSFVVCMFALFVFGFCKDFALSPTDGLPGNRLRMLLSTRLLRWRQIRRSCWEGIQMVMLGGTAALAAVLCVRLL